MQFFFFLINKPLKIFKNLCSGQRQRYLKRKIKQHEDNQILNLKRTTELVIEVYGEEYPMFGESLEELRTELLAGTKQP